jgi:hypothetical protein
MGGGGFKDLGLSTQNVQQLIVSASVIYSVRYVKCCVMLRLNAVNDHTLSWEANSVQLVKNSLSFMEPGN